MSAGQLTVIGTRGSPIGGTMTGRTTRLRRLSGLGRRRPAADPLATHIVPDADGASDHLGCVTRDPAAALLSAGRAISSRPSTGRCGAPANPAAGLRAPVRRGSSCHWPSRSTDLSSGAPTSPRTPASGYVATILEDWVLDQDSPVDQRRARHLGELLAAGRGRPVGDPPPGTAQNSRTVSGLSP